MKKMLAGFVAVTAIAAAGACLYRDHAGKLALTASEKQSLRDTPNDDIDMKCLFDRNTIVHLNDNGNFYKSLKNAEY